MPNWGLGLDLNGQRSPNSTWRIRDPLTHISPPSIHKPATPPSAIHRSVPCRKAHVFILPTQHYCQRLLLGGHLCPENTRSLCKLGVFLLSLREVFILYWYFPPEGDGPFLEVLQDQANPWKSRSKLLYLLLLSKISLIWGRIRY